MSGTNPYSKEMLLEYVGQEESQRLEFKSSAPLLNNDNKRSSFLTERITPAVSAFLNSEGGLLIVGIEERDGVAVGLSPGIPKSAMSWTQLQQIIVSKIQPSIAGNLNVYSVHVGEDGAGEKLHAFVVEVRSGATAYQADDRKYYARRAGESIAMDDKDIRLRMLSGDKPRLSIGVKHSLQTSGYTGTFVSSLTCDLTVKNVGIRTIPRVLVDIVPFLDGLGEAGCDILNAYSRSRSIRFEDHQTEMVGLMPGREYTFERIIDVSSTCFRECTDPAGAQISYDIYAYIDDGLPAELRNYNVMPLILPVIENGWRLPLNDPS